MATADTTEGTAIHTYIGRCTQACPRHPFIGRGPILRTHAPPLPSPPLSGQHMVSRCRKVEASVSSQQHNGAGLAAGATLP